MKPKLRLTVVVEYEADSYDYGTEDPQEMAEIDQSNFIPEDLGLYVEDDICISYKVKVEPVTEG